MVAINVAGADRFFAFAIARHGIYLRRNAGDPPPWTPDPILRKFKFTNVFRELDRTTVWYRENVRQVLDGRDSVLPATILFRWFNRIETCAAVFDNLGPATLGSGVCPFTTWLQDPDDGGQLRSVIREARGKGPYVTGAYIIKTPDGMDKLTGVLSLCGAFAKSDWSGMADSWRAMKSLEKAWRSLLSFPFMGRFMAYEVVSDIRHTEILKDATDIHTWANPGPGAMRGLNRIQGTPLKSVRPTAQMMQEMQTLLRMSNEGFWAYNTPWEMREVEHTLCEFDKYERVRLGEGRPRNLFVPHAG